MNFPSQIFFNDVNHDYRSPILMKNYLWLLPFYMAVATYCIIERYAEQCALQLYRTSLIENFKRFLSAFLRYNR